MICGHEMQIGVDLFWAWFICGGWMVSRSMLFWGYFFWGGGPPLEVEGV